MRGLARIDVVRSNPHRITRAAVLAMLFICRVGTAFSSTDWELVCDNTRTCRAAGYQSDDDRQPVSVLLTRTAGPWQQVKGQLRIGDLTRHEFLRDLPFVFDVSVRISGRDLGTVAVEKRNLVAELSSYQVAALVDALIRSSTVEFFTGSVSWHLSNNGALNVLLRMDEFQHRVGTPGALVKKGISAEGLVPPALRPPVTIAGPIVRPRSEDKQILRAASDLEHAFRATTRNDDCPLLFETQARPVDLFITRLSHSVLLASTVCRRGVYDEGYGYWVINDFPPYAPILVTPYGSNYRNGVISSSQRDRRLGDCRSFDQWTWDGKRFVHTASSSTGLCKLIAAGGAWLLPMIVSEVRFP